MQTMTEIANATGIRAMTIVVISLLSSSLAAPGISSEKSILVNRGREARRDGGRERGGEREREREREREQVFSQQP